MLNSLLSHPAITPLKRATKDAWLRYKARSIVNPPVPANVRSVLFVCLGNICRSPFAQLIAARRVNDLAWGPIRFASAGLRTKPDAEPPSEAKEIAATFGVSLEHHRAQNLTRALMQAHDMVVVMESSHMDHLKAKYPDLAERVFLLTLFEQGTSGRTRCAIADPFALPRVAFEECYQRIDRAVSALLAVLAQAMPMSHRGLGEE